MISRVLLSIERVFLDIFGVPGVNESLLEGEQAGEILISPASLNDKHLSKQFLARRSPWTSRPHICLRHRPTWKVEYVNF